MLRLKFTFQFTKKLWAFLLGVWLFWLGFLFRGRRGGTINHLKTQKKLKNVNRIVISKLRTNDYYMEILIKTMEFKIKKRYFSSIQYNLEVGFPRFPHHKK